jgi:hypothetical protein
MVELPNEVEEEAARTRANKVRFEDEAVKAAAEEQIDAEKRRKAQERYDRIQAEDQQVMADRKELVDNMKAVNEGVIPPTLKKEIDTMPPEQMRNMMTRIEGRIKKGDTIDELIEKMDPTVLDALTGHMRNRLGLQQLPKAEDAEKAKAKVLEEQKKHKMAEHEQQANVEHNFAKKAENLFGIKMYNRYVFALDH